jgi:A-macroglobulin receptor binding domain
VLEALRAVAQGSRTAAANAAGSHTAEIIVNGRPATTVTIPSENEISNPIYVDVSSFLTTGENHVEIRRPDGASTASAQLVTTYYIPWTSSEASTNEARRVNGDTALKLKVQFDRTETNITGAISCHIEAERVGFSGYGMMLAEIGLPPGADVDRDSIKQAMDAADRGISRYDILPDRVVFYLWPRAGGVKFDFKFRPRFAMNAKSAPSILYDYYNSEARTVVAPRSFVIAP